MEVNVIDKCFINDELGFMIGSVVVWMKKLCKVYVLLVNNINKIFKIKWG